LPISTKTSQAAGGAEQRFRDAFERLTLGVPEVLPKGTPVSQNNVAKEASCDPSALRKARFPLLVLEIQEWIETHKGDQPISARQRLLKDSRKNRDTRETIADLKRQRDIAAGLLADANLRIVELSQKFEDVQARLDEYQSSVRVLNLL
jgi:hypothetical protein